MSSDTLPAVLGTATGQDAPPSTSRDPWLTARLVALIAYVLSRGFVVAGAAAVVTERAIADRPEDFDPLHPPALVGNAGKGILEVLLDWDSAWYLRIVRMGYPRLVPPDVTYGNLEARAAFFPIYPFSVRTLARLLPGGDVWVAIGLNVVLGAAFVYVVGLLARRIWDVEVAQRAMVLTAMFPGSFVLLYAYSEAVMLFAMALCLWWLHERKWLAAGVAAAVVTAARPNGVAAAVACGVAALFAIKERREWKALVAPIVAPIGWLVFQVGLSRHANESGVWFRVQREAWGEGVSFGVTAISRTWTAISDPLGSPGSMFTLGSLVAMVVMIYGSWKVKIPPAWTAYSATVLLLMLLPSTVTARPRFLYTAFPLLIGFAAWWPKKYRESWGFVMAICGAGLVAVTAVYAARGAIP